MRQSHLTSLFHIAWQWLGNLIRREDKLLGKKTVTAGDY